MQHHRCGCESAQHVKAGDALCLCSHLWSPLEMLVKLSATAIALIDGSRGDQTVTSSRFREVPCGNGLRQAAMVAAVVGWRASSWMAR
jgi:hypothetical protein